MQRSGPVVTWATNDFDMNVMCLFDFTSAFTTVCTVRIALFGPSHLGARSRNSYCRGIPVLYARRDDRECDEQVHRIDEEVAFSTFDLLGYVNPLSPPCAEARVDWWPMTAAVGVLERPCVHTIVRATGLASARKRPRQPNARTPCRRPAKVETSPVIAVAQPVRNT